MKDKKRGIDLNNRVFDAYFAGRMTKAFLWWRGGKFNKLTFIFVALIFFINMFLVFPLVQRDLTVSFSSSAFLVFVASFFSQLGISTKQFYQFLALISLSFSPISIYLFARKMALRHELIALLVTLLFLLPNPFWGKGSPLITATLIGDGAHVFSFSFIPLLLLSLEAFGERGVPAWGIMSVLATSLIAMVSPFSIFNLIIFFTILTVAQGFLGEFRIKLMRMFLLLILSFGLSFFWYNPSVIMKIMILSHVSLAIQKFWSVFPLLIPAIPVFGAVSFLVFDRREKLKPIFIGLALSLVYLFLFSVSNDLRITGIFTPERYLLELAFSLSFLTAVLTVISLEFLARRYLVLVKSSNVLFFFLILFSSFLVSFLVLLAVFQVQAIHFAAASTPITSNYNLGLGGLQRVSSIYDPSFIFASIVSLATLIFLIILLFRFPSLSSIQMEKND